MTAPELFGWLADAEGLAAEFRTAASTHESAWEPEAAWPFRLATALESACTGLRSALSMLQDSDEVLAEQDETMLLTTGGLSVAPGDARTVAAALTDAAAWRREHGDADTAARYEAVSRKLAGAEPAPEAVHACPEGELLAAIRAVLDVADFASAADASFALTEIHDILRGGAR